MMDGSGESLFTMLAGNRTHYYVRTDVLALLSNHKDVKAARLSGAKLALAPDGDLARSFLRAVGRTKTDTANLFLTGNLISAFLETSPEFVPLIKDEDTAAVQRALGAVVLDEAAVKYKP